MTSTIENLKEEVLKLIEGPLKEEGCEVAELAIATFRKSATVRAYVYCQGGTNMARCAQLSHVIGNALDAAELFEGGYTLEVSSPGLDRPLQKAVDFKYRLGETVSIKFVQSKRPSTRAKIVAVAEDDIVFENESGPFTESVKNIERAKIVY